MSVLLSPGADIQTSLHRWSRVLALTGKNEKPKNGKNGKSKKGNLNSGKYTDVCPVETPGGVWNQTRIDFCPFEGGQPP